MKKIIYFLFFVSIIGCRSKPLAFFSVDPPVKMLKSKISYPINIILSPSIKDSLIVSGSGLRGVKVIEFRKSLTTSLTNTFTKNFSLVEINKVINDSCYKLEIKNILPYSMVVDTVQKQRYVTTTTTHYNNTPVYGAPGVNNYGGNSYLGGSNAVPGPSTTLRTTGGHYVPYDFYVATILYEFEYVLTFKGNIIDTQKVVVESDKDNEQSSSQEIFINGLQKMCEKLNDQVLNHIE